jgi:hypothetical protein
MENLLEISRDRDMAAKYKRVLIFIIGWVAASVDIALQLTV